LAVLRVRLLFGNKQTISSVGAFFLFLVKWLAALRAELRIEGVGRAAARALERGG